MMDADALIQTLQLKPHPEGGHYRETWRSAGPDGQRSACTAIHFLLKRGERSHWHRVDADEIWCFHIGDPLELEISDGLTTKTQTLSSSSALQAVVPAGQWQAARPLGAFSLVSCIVAPAFDFAGFELAAPGWNSADRA